MTNPQSETGVEIPLSKSRPMQTWYQHGMNAGDEFKLPIGTIFKTLNAPNDYDDCWIIHTWRIGEHFDKHLNRKHRAFYVEKEEFFDHDPREDK